MAKSGFKRISMSAIAVLATFSLVHAEDNAVDHTAIQPELGLSHIEVFASIDDRMLYVYKNNRLVQSYPVAVGKEDYETPEGTFGLNQVDWNPDWMPPDSEWSRSQSYKRPGDPENPLGLVRLVFKPSYNIHGTLEHWSVGEASSRGCIRLKNTDVINFARFLMNETGAVETNDFYQKVLNNPYRMERVQLPQTIPFTVKKQFEGNVYLKNFHNLESSPVSRRSIEPGTLFPDRQQTILRSITELLP